MSSRAVIHDLIDELVPDNLERWEDLVRRYPLPCLAAAAAGGFLLGRSAYGRQILAAVSSYAALEVAETFVPGLVGGDG